MPVTFKTDAVIDAAKAALKGHRAADVIYEKAKAKYLAEKMAERDMIPRMRALRDELSAVLKSKRQPTEDDAKRFRRAAGEDYLRNFYAGQVSDYDLRNNVEKPSGWLSTTTVASYQGLIKLLEAHTEDTISANQLKLLGYDRLEPLFRLAALASPVTDK